MGDFGFSGQNSSAQHFRTRLTALPASKPQVRCMRSHSTGAPEDTWLEHKAGDVKPGLERQFDCLVFAAKCTGKKLTLLRQTFPIFPSRCKKGGISTSV